MSFAAIARDRHYERIALALAVLGALRVFVFAAAYPVFNNVDEAGHFDAVYKYAYGRFPNGVEPFDPEAIALINQSASPEYLRVWSGAAVPAPRWTKTATDLRWVAIAAGEPNFEGIHPPLYYAMAGVWLRVGRWLGVGDLALPYWVRFLNVGTIGVAIWLGFRTMARLVPERSSVVLGATALFAFLPQDAFYSISSDSLAPLVGTGAFVGLAMAAGSGRLSRWSDVRTGLWIAAAGLTKVTAWPLILTLTPLVLAIRVRRVRNAVAPRDGIVGALVMLTGVVPIAAWSLYCYRSLGTFTGFGATLATLGIARKPWADLVDHPIFTGDGLWTFIHHTLRTLWRGEYVWHRQILEPASADIVFTLSSVCLVAVGVFAWSRRGAPAEERRLVRLAGLVVVAGALMLAWSSIGYEWGKFTYPSQTYPYVTSGRLLMPAVVPLLFLYSLGLQSVLARIRLQQWFGAVCGVLVAALILLDIYASRFAWTSLYNWLHLP